MEKTKIINKLQEYIYQYKAEEFSHIVILCIGTNKLIGDCIGPVVGARLKQDVIEKNVLVLGDMNRTVDFRNAKKVVEYIYKTYSKPFVITVDSALGSKEMIKKVVVSKGIVKIGKSLGRSICYPSNIIIKGVVGENKGILNDNIQVLKTVKPEIVTKISEIMTEMIKQIIQNIPTVK